MRTFASCQLMALQGSSQTSARTLGSILVEVSLRPEGDHVAMDFWGNCIADTELGTVPAPSTGKFEQAFLSKLATITGQQIATPKSTSLGLDAPAEEPYRFRSEFDPDDRHWNPLRTLHPGVSDRTAVKMYVKAPIATVWRATLQAAEQLAEIRGAAVGGIDPKFFRVQNGSINTDNGHDWREEFVTTLTDEEDYGVRITVVRQLRVLSRDSSSWRGAPSDAEIESWLIGRILLAVGVTDGSQK